jgi:hypothetical protein
MCARILLRVDARNEAFTGLSSRSSFADRAKTARENPAALRERFSLVIHSSADSA